MALRTLYQALLDSETARLRVIARLWNIPLTTGRRTDIAAELAATMAGSETAAAIYNRLPPDAKAALDDLMRHDGILHWAAFARRWGEIRIVGPGRLERDALWENPISPAETLWYHGLLYRATMIDDQGMSREVAYLPPDLMLYLPPPPPLQRPDPPAASPPSIIHTSGDRAADALAVLWGHLQQRGGRLQRGKLAADLQRELEKRLELPAEAIDLLLTLSLERGWLREGPRGNLRPSPQEALLWLRRTRRDQWADLLDAWRESRRWNDLAAVPTLRTADQAPWPNRARRTRTALLDLLAHLTPGLWYGIEAFVAYVHDHVPDFLRPDGDYESWNLRDRRTGAPLNGFDHWMEVEGTFLIHALLFTLPLLGLVDFGHRWKGLPPDRFRLSQAGEAFLTKAPLPDAGLAPLELRSDGTLIVPPGRRYELFQLHRIADWETTTLDRYRITPTSLARARRQRIPLARILTFLEESTAKPLPLSFRTALERAWSRGSEVRLRRLWLLQGREELLLEETIRPLVRERVGRQSAVTDEDDQAQLRRHLIELGFLPDVEV